MQSCPVPLSVNEFWAPPFRLDSLEAVNTAEEDRLLGLSRNHYRLMRAFAARHALVRPPALLAAHEHCHEDFLMLRTERIRETHEEPRALDALESIDDCFRIAEKLPFLKNILCHPDVFSYFGAHPVCGPLRGTAVPFSRYDWMQRIKNMIRHEMRRLIQTKSMHACTIEQLCEIITAYVLFLPANEDVLVALRAGTPDTPLYQNMLADLLFRRIPTEIGHLASFDFSRVKQKLHGKINRLGLSSRQKMFIFNARIKTDNAFQFINAFETQACKLPLSEQVRGQLRDYAASLRATESGIMGVYDYLFLDDTLHDMRAVTLPLLPAIGSAVHHTVHYREVVKTHFTGIAPLDFYPCKDYLDLIKSNYSVDCSKGALGRLHLLCPEFFNIRIFNSNTNTWVGNIYILDFTQETGMLVIDRIQIPRDSRADYITFFTRLKKVLCNLFEQVPYKKIIMPTTISNHAFIQDAWHRYRKNRKPPAFKTSFPCACAQFFESLCKSRTFFVFAEKEPGTE
jgi:hypothetical protein